MIIVDTSVLSRAFRRRRSGPDESTVQRALQELMASELPLGLPGVVLQEILSGIRSERQFEDLREMLLASFTILPATVSDHVEAARLKNTCERQGLNVSGIDCLIAVCAITGNHELLAVDDDFPAIARHAPLKMYQATA